jgi:hypothetical protein
VTHPCRPPSPAQILNHKSDRREIPHRFKTVEIRSSADFVDDLPMGEAEHLIEDIEREMKACVPDLTSIYIRPEKQADALQQSPPS